MKDLKCIKNNFFILLFSALFSAMLVISKHFILNTDSCFDARMKDVTVYDFHWFDIVAVLAFTVVIFAFLSTAVEIVSRGLSRLAARRGTVSEGQSIPSADSEPPETASARIQKLIAIQKRITAENFQNYIGQCHKVLVDAPSRRDPRQMSGKNEYNITVNFDGTPELIGQIVPVTITEARETTLRGTTAEAKHD